MPLPYLKRNENPLRLKGRMPLLHWPRFRPTAIESTRFLWWCLSTCLFVTMLTMCLDAFRAILALPVWFVMVDAVRWWRRYSDGNWFLPKLRFLTLPYLTFWLVAVITPLCADFVAPRFWYGAVLGIIVWRLIRVSQKVREHYLDYCLEHEALSETTRQKWRDSRAEDWLNGGMNPAPATAFRSPSEQRQFSDALATLRSAGMHEWLLAAGTLATALWVMNVFDRLNGAVFRSSGMMLLVGLAIIGTTVIPVIIRHMMLQGIGEDLTAVWHAVQVFCHSPPTVPVGSRAPWSPRSRYGDAENRRSYLVWNVLLIGFLLISAVVLYPLVGGDTVAETGIRYPLGGSMMFVRLGPDPTFVRTPMWLSSAAFAATLLVTPIYVCAGLLWLVGPVSVAGRYLFESDGAVEHERQTVSISQGQAP